MVERFNTLLRRIPVWLIYVIGALPAPWLVWLGATGGLGVEPIKALEHELGVMMIGPDKVNQLRHARFLKGRLQQHMQAHAEILRPKFSAVQEILQQELDGLEVAQWTDPIGGYFVSLDLLPGLASQVVDMAQSVGLTLTPAGATIPYGRDPRDRNIRIAPTMPSVAALSLSGVSSDVCQYALSGPYVKSMTFAVGMPASMSGTWSSVSA